MLLCLYLRTSFIETPPWRWPQKVTETCRKFTMTITYWIHILSYAICWFTLTVKHQCMVMQYLKRSISIHELGIPPRVYVWVVSGSHDRHHQPTTCTTFTAATVRPQEMTRASHHRDWRSSGDTCASVLEVCSTTSHSTLFSIIPNLHIYTIWGIWSAESMTTHCVRWLCYGVGNQRTGAWFLAGEGIFLFFMVSEWHLGHKHTPMQHETGNLPLWVRQITF